jgi:hypothetical protein
MPAKRSTVDLLFPFDAGIRNRFGKYDWLNRIVAVATGRRASGPSRCSSALTDEVEDGGNG